MIVNIYDVKHGFCGYVRDGLTGANILIDCGYSAHRGYRWLGCQRVLRDENVCMALDSFLKVDTYSWRARIAPVLVALLPVPLAVFVCFPGSSVVARIVAILGAPALLLWLLSEIGRDLGKRKEPKLWKSWGGAPTTQRLRFATPDTNVALVERYHRLLSELDPTLDLPTAAGEASEPRAADQAYEVATKWLIDKTRDTDKFKLLFKENVSYGFRRNLWGLKPLALPFAIVGAALCVAGGWPPVGGVELDWAVACAVSIGLVVFWVGWVRPSWVRIPAEAYADRLFEACERLQASRKQ